MQRTMLVRILILICALAAVPSGSLALSANDLSGLSKDQALGDFQVVHLYSDREGKIVGVKFRHAPTGAPVFLFQIETIPQAFMWVDTPADPADANKGLPHALEHLLAGKGTKGRYQELLFGMRLGDENAATYFDFNFYSLSSAAGLNSFFDVLHAYLDALYRPDFTDTEAKREFYHLAVTNGRGNLGLAEQGTVYNEMESYQGRYSYDHEALKRALGNRNPLVFESGGIPDDMRAVTVEEIRKFHSLHYRISPTTGFIFVIDPKDDVPAFLARVSRELTPFSGAGESVAKESSACTPKYPIDSSDSVTPGIYPFPSKSSSDPGAMAFAWKPVKAESPEELKLLELLLHGLAGGEQSSLYKSLIDSKTREADSGATGLYDEVFLRNSPCFPIARVELSGTPGDRISSAGIEDLRNRIAAKIKEISEYPDHSEKLLAFNQMIASYVRASRRSERVWIKTSPKFGDSLESRWKEHLEKLEIDPSFVQSLSEEPVWNSVEQSLASGRNIWAEVIRTFHLMDTPYATASIPSPQLLEELGRAKKDRILAKTRALMESFETNDEQEALARFQRDELTKTKEIDAIAARVPHPGFLDHPPLTMDDGIRYQQTTFRGVPAITSIFDGAPTLDLGLSFDLHGVPKRFYRDLPLLPRCLDALGLREEKEIVSYSDLIAQIEKELYSFAVDYEANPRTRRADLSIRLSTTDPKEFRTALSLIRRMTQESYLDVANQDRLRDVIDQRISADDAYTKQHESDWIENPEMAFRFQSDPLYLAVRSQFTRAHWDARLKWRLRQQVPSEQIAQLNTFAQKLLDSLVGLSKGDVAKRLDRVDAQQLEEELVAYWKKNLSSFADTELLDGLRKLTREVQEDLAFGPAKSIEELKQLQRIVFNRRALHVELMVSRNNLAQVTPDLLRFLDSIPVSSVSPQPAPQLIQAPISRNARKRYPNLREQFPSYLAFVNADGVTGNAVFTAKFTRYSRLDRASLTQSLSSRIYGGGGPHSFFMKTWEAGLAYSNGVAGHLGSGSLEYYAERSPDLPSLISLVNSLAAKKPDPQESGLLDYLFSQELPQPRTGASFSERATELEKDIRDGNSPEIVRRHSEASLALRKDPHLQSKIVPLGSSSIAPVLLEKGHEIQQRREKSIFFFVAPESIISEVEQKLRLPMLVRLWPSDYWIP